MLDVIPVLRYRNPNQAVTWLEGAFGFSTGLVTMGENDTVVHAQLHHGDGCVMVGAADEEAFGTERRASTVGVYLVIHDVDTHHANAKAHGATILNPPYDTDYGSREYAAKDLEGHDWSFGTYAPVKPD